MAIVIEIFATSARVFRTAANFMTYDDPETGLLCYRFCATDGEAVAIYRKGAEIFSAYGPAGYLAFSQFERFLTKEGLVESRAQLRARRKKDMRYRKSP